MSSLRERFEQTEVFKRFNNTFSVYYTNLGGYRFLIDNEPSLYLNGAWEMFQELNK